MPRRLERYDSPAWQPYLIVAELGAVAIMLGIVFQIVQLAVSIRDRAALCDTTGDPWDGRTLEWATTSPPAPYNFAVIPQVSGIDAFWTMKKAGTAGLKPARFHDIVMPDNSAAGFVLGVGSFAFAFAMVWYIWWLVALGGLVVLAAALSQTFRDHAEYPIPAAEVEAIENRRGAAPAVVSGVAS
jgi:cytochrome o ubiquinol oxidase subunit 1